MTDWDKYVLELGTGSKGIVDVLKAQSHTMMKLNDLEKEVAQNTDLPVDAVSRSFWHLLGDRAVTVSNRNGELFISLGAPA